MHLMETVRRLQHVKILIELVIFADELVTEHAEALLSHLLHLLVNRGCPLFLVRTQEIVQVSTLNVSFLCPRIFIIFKAMDIIGKHHFS